MVVIGVNLLHEAGACCCKLKLALDFDFSMEVGFRVGVVWMLSNSAISVDLDS